MKLVAKGLPLIALLALGACAGNMNKPTDTGNMTAPPVGTQPGMVGQTTQGRDVGSMSTPAVTGGTVVTAPMTRDTGSMALPPSAQGNSLPRNLTP